MVELLAACTEGLFQSDLALRAAIHLKFQEPPPAWKDRSFLAPLIKGGLLASQWNRWHLRREWHAPVLDLLLETGRFKALAGTFRADAPWDFPDYPIPSDRGLIQLRLRALLGQRDEVQDLHQSLADARFGGAAPHFMTDFLDPAFPRLWAALDPDIRKLAAYEAWLNCAQDLGRSQPRVEAIQALEDPEINLVLDPYIALLKGDRAGAAQALKRLQPTGVAKTMKGWLEMLEGRASEALATFDERIKEERKERRRRKCGIHGFGALLHAFALLKAARGRHAEAITWLQGQITVQDPLKDCAAFLGRVIEGQSLNSQFLQERARIEEHRGSALEQLILGSALAWEGLALPAPFTKDLRSLRAGLPEGAWGRPELDLLLDGPSAKAPGLALARWIQPVPAWEKALEALESLTPAEGAAPDRPRRLAWVVSVNGKGFIFDVEPKDQKRGPRGWGKGQTLSAGRSLSPIADPWVQDQDFPALEAWRDWADERRWGGPDAEDLARVLERLAGHPFAFLSTSGVDELTPLHVENAGPELRVEQGPAGRVLRLHPPLPRQGSTHLELQGDRLRVIRFQESHRRAAGLLDQGLTVPEAGLARLEALLPRLAQHFPLQSDAPIQGATAEPLEGDPTLQLILQPIGQGLRVTARLRPIPGGPWVRPGEGGEAMVATLEGRLVQTRRDLADERARVEELLLACPALAEGEDGPFEFRLPDPAQALELLEALDIVQGRAQAHWPEGAALSLAGRMDERAFHVSATGTGGWFEASAELRLDDGQTLSLVELLRLVEDQPGRFVTLGQGRYLALTAAFRKRLGELAAFGEAHGKAWRLPALTAPLLGGELEGDAGFQSLVARYQEAFSAKATLPKGLQAELRPYQDEGFQWLTRMAAWEAGAVLADDMGLGKTVMTLALLLQRAAARKGGGPALVVAPTSVMANWESEAARFAPALTFHRYHDADREDLLRNLGKRDVVLTSYGLLQRDAEAFASLEWHTLVLDEAQALKNAQAKRSQAAAGLQARFRLALSGTPLENHLGELWSLFRILNPGLLGSQDRFNRRFAGPIERDKDTDTLHRLQRLVRPFLLRRTKAEVLEDLPERTEILREVELSREETALYEALRRRAMEGMEAAVGAPPGQRAVKMLAELMKLRRVCCHPSLAMPGWAGPASKLEAFQELADELREGGHRTLVFSQFVDHLHIVRDWMESQKIPFQYLDGSTPAKARAKAVDAFQGGEGDFFLISLTAGGTGLNLTAADYVVILDPWWNPAVEDQASSRAHRMGQQRPVTVYRLVAKGTLEAKIVQLHHQKRELAESILASGEGGGRLSPEALLELLREGAG